MPSISLVDYVFTMDRNAGRTLEIQRRGDQWTSPSRCYFDIVDNTSGFTLAMRLSSRKIFVTGRMVRSNDIEPIGMDISPLAAPYEFGRYKFLTEDTSAESCSWSDHVHYIGLGQRFHALSTETSGC